MPCLAISIATSASGNTVLEYHNCITSIACLSFLVLVSILYGTEVRQEVMEQLFKVYLYRPDIFLSVPVNWFLLLYLLEPAISASPVILDSEPEGPEKD